MSWLSDSTELVAGGWLSSAYPGHGITGAAVRATTGSGTNGAGIFYNDWKSSADDAKEFRAVIESVTAGGVVALNEDGSYTRTWSVDGTQSFVYRLYVDGVSLGLTTATQLFGDPITNFVYTGSGGVSSGGAATASMVAAANFAYAGSGGIQSGGAATASHTRVFIFTGSGGIKSGGSASASFTTTAINPGLPPTVESWLPGRLAAFETSLFHLSPMAAGATEFIGFNFTSLLPVGRYIASATCTCTRLSSGVPVGAQNVGLFGSPVIIGAVVGQAVSGLSLPARYKIVCSAVLDNGDRLVPLSASILVLTV